MLWNKADEYSFVMARTLEALLVEDDLAGARLGRVDTATGFFSIGSSFNSRGVPGGVRSL
jgi:hypothetical protein